MTDDLFKQSSFGDKKICSFYDLSGLINFGIEIYIREGDLPIQGNNRFSLCFPAYYRTVSP